MAAFKPPLRLPLPLQGASHAELEQLVQDGIRDVLGGSQGSLLPIPGHGARRLPPPPLERASALRVPRPNLPWRAPHPPPAPRRHPAPQTARRCPLWTRTATCS